MTDANIPAGSFGMYDHYIPGVKAGRYALRIASTMDAPDAAEPFYQEEKEFSFTVTAPRFFLRVAEDVRGCSPPHAGAANYDWILPNIVLKKRALPWERSVDGDPQSKTRAPWLALIVVTQEEMRDDGALVQAMTKDEFIASSDAGIYAPWLDPNQRSSWVRDEKTVIGLSEQEEKQSISVLEMSAELFRSLCPRPSESSLLAHVRRVNVEEKQDDDTREEGSFAILLANRLAQPGNNIVFLVSIEGWLPWLENKSHALDKPRVRVIALHSWSFHNTTGDGSFRQSVENLQPAMLVDARMKETLTDGSLRERLSQGYTPIAYQPEGAPRTFAWYRGPLAPVRVPSFQDGSIVFNMADEALIVDMATGIADISYSSAWQLGRLLALTSASYGRALLHWNHVEQAAALNDDANVRQPKSIAEEMAAYSSHHTLSDSQTAALVDDIRIVSEWLGARMLLQQIPFRYLVPSAHLLPPESLRFFYVDDNWLDALFEGALSLGASSLSEKAFKRSTRSSIRSAIRQMMLVQAKARRNNAEDILDPDAPLCGFLLRSSILTRFPGLEIELVGTADEVKPTIVRMEIIGHELLLVLVLGQDLQGVVFKVPRESLAYRADQGHVVPRVTDPREKDFAARRTDRAPCEVKTRNDGATGVVDIAALAKSLETESGAQFALHLLSGPDDVQVTWKHANDTAVNP